MLAVRSSLKTAQPACALCHALKDVGSEAEVGPNLDEFKTDSRSGARSRDQRNRSHASLFRKP